MWKTKFFWKMYSRYALFAFGMAIFLVLIILLGQNHGFSDTEVDNKSAVSIWWLKYVSGFPLGWFVYGKDINWFRSFPLIILVTAVCSIIQWFILFYSFRWFLRRQ